MRFAYAVVAAICAAVASAQNNAISIPPGAATLDVTAGQPLTITWTKPSSGTVTIKLQQDPVTPDSGVVLASGIPASDGTATLQIPPAGDVNAHVYTIEIIDDTNPSNINFSPNFGIAGATGTATGVVTGSATATDSLTSIGSSTDSSSATSTDSLSITITESSSSSATSSSSSESNSNSNSSTAASTTSSQQSTSSTSSAQPTESTTAPNSGNGAGSLKVQGGLLAMAVGLIAVI